MPNHTHLYYNTAFLPLLLPANRTAAANSTGMDLQNCDDAALVFDIGLPGDTLSGATRIELEVQESVDNTTFTAVADTDLTSVVTGGVTTGTVAIINASGLGSQIYQVGYRGTKRYIRGVLNYVGTHTNGTPAAIVGLTGLNRALPVNP
jgi:hypothetical protein